MAVTSASQLALVYAILIRTAHAGSKNHKAGELPCNRQTSSLAMLIFFSFSFLSSSSFFFAMGDLIKAAVIQENKQRNNIRIAEKM